MVSSRRKARRLPSTRPVQGNIRCSESESRSVLSGVGPQCESCEWGIGAGQKVGLNVRATVIRQVDRFEPPISSFCTLSQEHQDRTECVLRCCAIARSKADEISCDLPDPWTIGPPRPHRPCPSRSFASPVDLSPLLTAPWPPSRALPALFRQILRLRLLLRLLSLLLPLSPLRLPPIEPSPTRSSPRHSTLHQASPSSRSTSSLGMESARPSG